jgi:phage portal protein BeeE
VRLVDRLLVRSGGESWGNPSIDEWLELAYQGNTYGLSPLNQTLLGGRESIPNDFEGYAGVTRRNGVVFAVLLARLQLFTEARFAWRRLGPDGRPGDLFRDSSLEILDHPWPNGQTGDLLARMIQHADLAGNSYTTRLSSGSLRQLRPDWVEVVIGTDATTAEMTEAEQAAEAYSIESEVLGYLYHPGGKDGTARTPSFLTVDDVAHFAPMPDPTALHRGMSWLTPVLREIAADSAATSHKLKFFENGATPNLVVKLPVTDPAKFDEWVERFDERHEGLAKAYKTLFVGGGADATVVGANLRQLDFKATQGAGETRIAAAGGVPPVIVGLSEGLAAATYSNYHQARRRMADLTHRPLWRGASGALATIVTGPGDAELSYDDRDIPALAEDQKDAATIHQIEATTIRNYTDAGFTPESAIAAVKAGDPALLVHTGKFSVQLQPPGESSGAEAGRALAEIIAPYLKQHTSQEDEQP